MVISIMLCDLGAEPINEGWLAYALDQIDKNDAYLEVWIFTRMH